MHSNALVIIVINGQAQQILLAEAGGKAACASDTLVEVIWVSGVPVFGKVGVNLLGADDNEIHTPFDKPF